MNPTSLLALIAVAVLSGCAPSPEGAKEPLPWEFWTDARNLPRVTGRNGLFLRSSYCPAGCRFDRHSSGDSRFLRVQNGEGVLLDEQGPGALTRLWMTMGHGVSQPLDRAIRIRIYLDGEALPRIDLPISELFAGNQSPFAPPLVGDRSSSSGGHFSYVPIAYRTGCRVTLVGAQDARIWFQINYHRLKNAEGVTTFSGKEDLEPLISLLRSPGADPWSGGDASVSTGEVELPSGESVSFFVAEAPGLVTGLWLDIEQARWDELRLMLTFDGHTTVDLPLRDAFAIGRGGSLPTRSLLVGLDAAGSLYSFFPMPHFRRVEMRLGNTGPPDGESTTIAYRVRRIHQRPAPDSGLFGSSVRHSDFEVPGRDLPLLELDGEGKWVGLFSEFTSADTRSRLYLEGDEHVYLDGSPEPALHGTGVEDLFNGGFYFDRGPFRQALHGMTYQFVEAGRDITAAYRLLLTDAVSFETAIRVGLEAGPTGETPMSVRTVAYYYLRLE